MVAVIIESFLFLIHIIRKPKGQLLVQGERAMASTVQRENQQSEQFGFLVVSLVLFSAQVRRESAR